MKKWLVSFSILLLLGSFGAQGISAAEPQQSGPLYVAKTEALCAGYSNCFFNDIPDLSESNALTKAIGFARDNTLINPSIYILSPYEINSHTIKVDYPVTIIGVNGGWISTSYSDCGSPMFTISAQTTIRDISLNDGVCIAPSRDLLVINSSAPVLIDHSTLEDGQTAVTYQGGTGQLTLQSNHINNNQFAINSTSTANLLVVANNITANGTSTQASCVGNSNVDHNFWGTGVLPSQSAPGCGADDAKRLDAPIVKETTGVAARLMTLTNSLPSTDFYGFKASSSNPVDLYVVNHGNSPPFTEAAGSVEPCSNYYDVFLPQGASPTSVLLSFAYRDTTECAPIIQSAAFCGSGVQTKFPLLWYDPKTRVTDKWDKTGDNPQSSTGSIFAGQETTCRPGSKTIEVVLVDNSGRRPDLFNDLHFTPFVIGFEQAGVLSFTASPGTNAITLNWATITEVNTLSYSITRSNTADGTYNKISDDILATGSPTTGSSYSFTDSNAVTGQTYYYKLVVLNIDGSLQQSLGPLSASIQPLTTPTKTATLSRTPSRTPTRTLTPVYRSPTPFRTATSAFKTVGPEQPTLFLPTDTETPTLEQTSDLSLTPADTPTTTLTPSRTPTPTVSGTPRDGSLGKTDRYSGQKQLPFILGGVAVLLLITLLAIYIHKKR